MKDKKLIVKKWNVSLKVNPLEEQRIKIGAIKRGMGVGEYIKKIVLDDLSKNTISNQ